LNSSNDCVSKLCGKDMIDAGRGFCSEMSDECGILPTYGSIG